MKNGGKGRFIYFARALDRSFVDAYIRNKGRERERIMLHFLLLLLIPAKIALAAVLVYYVLRLLLQP
tara:strand:+ start:1304 stop:1504 length:201 start_codon:yes stop_codon:yes gene_type:complete